MKKLLKLFLICISSFCMINTVKAEGTGVINISGTTDQKTYEIYKIFDLTYSGSNVAYTIDSDWNSFFGVGGLGESYIVTLPTDSDGNVIDPNNLNQISIGEETKYINITDANVAEFTNKAITYIVNQNLSADKSAVATGTSLQFSGLELGYYLVYPKGATDILAPNASICSVTSTAPVANINIKADYPTIDKSVDKNSFDVGEYAEFKITGQVPDTTGYTSYTYEIRDTWTAGLLLDTANVNFTVKFDNTPIQVTPTYSENGFVLTFDMVNYQEYKGKEIVITYNLKITEEAIDSDSTQNSATLTYSNNPKDREDKITTPPVIKKVYSSKIEVLKVDGADGKTPLEGAKFVLKNSKNEYYKAITQSDEDNTKLEIIAIRWETNIENATVFVSNENGIVTYDEKIIGFSGLKDGEYKLVEIEAPQGFNRLTSPIDVTLQGTNDDKDNFIPVIQELTVENHAGTLLPSTGGMGSKIFAFVGLSLIILSACVLVTNKRMAKEFE